MTMTKRKDTLAEACELTAARSAWAIQGCKGKPPKRVAPKHVEVLFKALESDKDWFAALAQFGVQRWMDFRREAPTAMGKSTASFIQDQELAREKGKAAHHHLQAARKELEAACRLWKQSVDAEFGRGSMDGATPPAPEAAWLYQNLIRVRDAAAQLDASALTVRTNGRTMKIKGDDVRFTSLEGLSTRQWQAALKPEIQELLDAGVPAQYVAVIVDWNHHDPKRAKKNLRRRVSKKSRGRTT